MTFYPLLSRGSAAQYPIERIRRWRNRKVETPGGHAMRAVDRAARRVRWRLRYDELSDAEATAIATFFEQRGGGLETFGFVDPLHNLLTSSSALDAVAWTRDPLVSVAASQDAPEPGGTSFVVTNMGQAAGGLSQSVTLPDGYSYCFSCWVKGGAVDLVVGSTRRTFVAGGQWTRIALTADELAAAPTVTVAILVPPGLEAGIYGPQLEAQMAPSAYKPTSGRGGIYLDTRFARDELRVTTRGPGRNSLEVWLESKVPE